MTVFQAWLDGKEKDDEGRSVPGTPVGASTMEEAAWRFAHVWVGFTRDHIHRFRVTSKTTYIHG